MLFAGLKNAFRQKRIVLVVSNYKILDAKKDKFGRDIDCMVRFNLHGQLRFNFDFFNSGFETGSMIFDKNGSKMLIDREYLKAMKVMGKVNNHSFLDFPIRFNTGNQTPELDANFKLPCVMRKSDLNKYLCSSGIKNLVNGLT